MRVNRNWHGLRYWSVGLFACFGWMSASGASSVAMLTDLQGNVALAGDPKLPALSILSELNQDSRVVLGNGAHATIVYLNSGQEYELSGPAEVQLAADHPASITGFAPRQHGAALTRSHESIRINPVQVTQAAIVMRSFAPIQKLKLLNLFDSTTLELHPTFQWQPPQSGLHYKIALLDNAGKTIFSTTVDDVSLRLPESVPLQVGVDYTWMVSTKDASGKNYSNTGDFSLASEDLRAQVERLRPGTDAHLSERVVFAAWLEQMHLRDEAHKLWKAVAEERQNDANLKVLTGE